MDEVAGTYGRANDMAPNWDLAAQETVQANGYVPLPDPVREAVETDHPVEGPSVVWNYDRASDYAVLSAKPLQQPEYVTAGRYRVYGIEDERPRVRPPEGLPEVITSRFVPESRVVYLAYEAMVDGEAPSVYFLSTPQLLDLLPEDAEAARAAVSDGGPGPLREALLRTPGFLPRP
jgi:hypothetical protein